MNMGVLRRLAAAVVLVMVLLLTVASQTGMATVWNSWDWPVVGTEKKRKLSYCVEPNFNPGGADINWDNVVINAAANWNKYGLNDWFLNGTTWIDVSCQIKIVSGNIVDVAVTHCPRDIDNRVSVCTITMSDSDIHGKDDGSDAATTYNPIWTMMHEFAHAMRADHDGNGQITRPNVGRNDDENEIPNQRDLDELNAAAKAPIKKAQLEITPEVGGSVTTQTWHGGPLLAIDVPPGAVVDSTKLQVSVDNWVSTPDSDLVPTGSTPIIRSVYFKHDASINPLPLLEPADITICYADMFEPVTGSARELSSAVVPSGSGLPGVSEGSLRVLTRKEGTGNPWVPVGVTTSIDTVNHCLTFIAGELGTYGLAGTPSVGGIAELPGVAESPLQAPDSSGVSAGVLAGIVAGSVLAGAASLGGAGWYARRRLR